MKLKEIQTNTIEGLPLLLCECTEGVASNGKPYCTLSVTDGETKVNAKYWERTKEDLSKFQEGSIVFFKLKAKEYNGAVTYDVVNMDLADSRLNILDFIIHSPEPGEQNFNDAVKTIRVAVPSPVGDFTIMILEKYKEQLLYWSAATKVHHSCHGGLIWHSFSVLKFAYKIMKNYEESYPEMLNKTSQDVILCSAILHDIGKIKEIQTDTLGVAEYNGVGSTLGHLYLGALMIADELKNWEDYKVNPEPYDMIIHSIISHHGKEEFGAIKKPCTVEAYIVSMADMLDSRMNIWHNTLDGIKPGEFGSACGMLDGVNPYKPTYYKE